MDSVTIIQRSLCSLNKNAKCATTCQNWFSVNCGYFDSDTRRLMVILPNSENKPACITCFLTCRGQERLTPAEGVNNTCAKHILSKYCARCPRPRVLGWLCNRETKYCAYHLDIYDSQWSNMWWFKC